MRNRVSKLATRLAAKLSLGLFGILSMASVTGCEPDPPHLEWVTKAPVGKLGELDNDKFEIRMSQGVALAFECRDERNAHCDGLALEGGGGAAQIYAVANTRLSEERLRTDPGETSSGKATSRQIVVVGISPGKSSFRFDAGDGAGAREMTVVVELGWVAWCGLALALGQSAGSLENHTIRLAELHAKPFPLRITANPSVHNWLSGNPVQRAEPPSRAMDSLVPGNPSPTSVPF